MSSTSNALAGSLMGKLGVSSSKPPPIKPASPPPIPPAFPPLPVEPPPLPEPVNVVPSDLPEGSYLLPPSKKKPRISEGKQSKKLDLAKLPKDWRKQVFAHVHQGKKSNLASAVAVSWATGCRPSEIALGVKVTRDGDHVILHIKGVKKGKVGYKVTEEREGKLYCVEEGESDRGLEWRQLKLKSDFNDATKYLFELAGDDGAEVKYNKNSLRTRLNEAGKIALKKLKDTPTISPYTFRHAMGSDVKSCDDLTDEQRSMIMGHLSCTSLSVYGRRRHKGNVSPVAEVTASEIPHGEYTYEPAKKQKAKPK